MSPKIKAQMIARWAMFELAMLLSAELLEMEEHDVTDSIEPSCAIVDADIFSYHATTYSFWVYVLPSPEGQIRVSAMTRCGEKYGYYKFIFSSEGEFQRIRRLKKNGASFRWET